MCDRRGRPAYEPRIRSQGVVDDTQCLVVASTTPVCPGQAEQVTRLEAIQTGVESSLTSSPERHDVLAVVVDDVAKQACAA